MSKLIKICFFCIVFLLLILINLSPIINLYSYWLILFVLTFFIWKCRINSQMCLAIAAVFFVVASLIVLFGFKSFAEALMRFSFVILIISYIQILIEYRSKEY